MIVALVAAAAIGAEAYCQSNGATPVQAVDAWVEAWGKTDAPALRRAVSADAVLAMYETTPSPADFIEGAERGEPVLAAMTVLSRIVDGPTVIDQYTIKYGCPQLTERLADGKERAVPCPAKNRPVAEVEYRVVAGCIVSLKMTSIPIGRD